MNDAPSRKQDQFIVRLPDGMRDRIKQAAEANNRSMNAEIVARLEKSLQSRDELQKAVTQVMMDVLFEMVQKDPTLLEMAWQDVEKNPVKSDPKK